MRFILCLLAVVTSAGCYGYYAPLSTDLSGRQVQLSLTDSGSLALAPHVGNGIEAIDGKMVADSAGAYLISIFGTRRRDGQEATWKGEMLDIPRPFVSTVSERRFSRARTLLFTGVTTVAMVAIKHAFGGAGGANAPGGTGPGPGPR